MPIIGGHNLRNLPHRIAAPVHGADAGMVAARINNFAGNAQRAWEMGNQLLDMGVTAYQFYAGSQRHGSNVGSYASSRALTYRRRGKRKRGLYFKKNKRGYRRRFY